MFQESRMRNVGLLVGIMAVIALGAYTYSTLKQARYMYSGPTSISVVGEGEVFATPDIATFSFNVDAKEADAVTAQNKAKEAMDAIVAYLKDAGVAEKDIKTDYYNLNPRYEYPETVCTQYGCPPQKEPKLIGFEVSQSVTVKVRDTAKAGDLLSGVGSKGAVSVSTLSFTIDDDESLKAEARAKAIEDAKAKAKVLAKNLDARIIRMNGYWEDQNGGGPVPYYGMAADSMKNQSMTMEVAPQAATLPTGENKITSKVNISYEIRTR
jgi:uncharacterized protein YggE